MKKLNMRWMCVKVQRTLFGNIVILSAIVGLYALTMTFAMPPPVWALSGDGTAASPYAVSTGDELDEALTTIAEDYRSVDPEADPAASTVNLSDMHYIRLTDDIDAVTSPTYGNEDEDHPVRVTIEGDGHAIRGTIPSNIPAHEAGTKYTGLRFANRTPWTETDSATGTGRGNHIVLKNLTVSGLYNKENHGGGAFAVFGGKMEVDNCVFSGNAAYGGTNRGGGAILLQHRASVLLVRNSAFINNSATGSGGAIDSSGDQENVTLGENVIIENSTFYGNKSGSASGGGAITYSRARGRITNCTIVGNEATTSGKGGGVYVRDNITGNPSGLGSYGDVVLTNSIVAGNGSDSYTDVDLVNRNDISSYPDNYARIAGDYNLIGTSEPFDTVSFGTNTSMGVNVSALLASGAPKVNSQGTPTIALLYNASDALDKIPLANAPVNDQRGLPRVGLADIGAYELQGVHGGNDDPGTDPGTGSGTESGTG
jgi:hypothetical protein